MKNIKIIAVLLIICLLFAVFSSCKNNDDEKPGNIDGQSGQTETAPPDVDSMREQEIIPDYLPDADYGGYEFNVLTFDSAVEAYATFISYDIYTEAETGEPINDAV